MELPPSLPIVRKIHFYNYLFLLLSLVVFLITYSSYLLPSSPSVTSLANLIWPNPKPSKKNKDDNLPPFAIGKGDKECNLFSGKWIWDDSNRPLYKESECPYLLPQVTCQAHGRKDKDYLYWRWQPDCCIPRFNASLMLESLRGKRMMFVGDSLNRGQFNSMLCLLHEVIPNKAKSLHKVDSFTIFTAKDYNATIEFYWAPFLLESNADSPGKHRVAVPDRIVRKNSIDTHGKYWKGVDIMVFNTYIWWMSGRTFKILNGTFDDNIKDVVDVPTSIAYRMGMKNLLWWINENMDPKRNRVFFTSMSPSHAWSKEWGGDPNGNCYNETKMIEDPNYWGSDSRKSIMQVIGEEFGKSKMPITFLNITELSMPRRDAHTSIYKERWGPLRPEEKVNPSIYADCIHWCLPGLQDVWNELLFAKLFYP